MLKRGVNFGDQSVQSAQPDELRHNGWTFVQKPKIRGVALFARELLSYRGGFLNLERTRYFSYSYRALKRRSTMRPFQKKGIKICKGSCMSSENMFRKLFYVFLRNYFEIKPQGTFKCCNNRTVSWKNIHFFSMRKAFYTKYKNQRKCLVSETL